MSTYKTAKCETPGCNNLVYYKTRKKRFCKKCKNPEGSNSVFEWNTFQVLNKVIDSEYINNGFYSWMLSPKGAPLQLDRFYPSLNLAFEIQGIQHTTRQPYYQTKEQFEYLKKCDIIKKKVCKERGITLIHIKHNEIATEALIKKKIYNKNRELYKKIRGDEND